MQWGTKNALGAKSKMNVYNAVSELGGEFTGHLGSMQFWLQTGCLQVPIHTGTVERWTTELGVRTLGPWSRDFQGFPVLVSRTDLVYSRCPGVIINCSPFHSQDCPG